MAEGAAAQAERGQSKMKTKATHIWDDNGTEWPVVIVSPAPTGGLVFGKILPGLDLTVEEYTVRVVKPNVELGRIGYAKRADLRPIDE